MLVPLVFLSGCSLDATLEDISKPFIPFFQKVSGAEFVSGSTAEYQTTLNGYKVMASVGHYIPNQALKTPNGYFVFSSVQGNMLSDELAAEGTDWQNFNPNPGP